MIRVAFANSPSLRSFQLYKRGKGAPTPKSSLPISFPKILELCPVGKALESIFESTIEQPPIRLVGWRFYEKQRSLKLSARQAFWCTVQLLFWAKLPLKSHTQSHLLCFHFFRSRVFLCCSSIFLPHKKQQTNATLNCNVALQLPFFPTTTSIRKGHLWRSTPPEPWCFFPMGNGGFFTKKQCMLHGRLPNGRELPMTFPTKRPTNWKKIRLQNPKVCSAIFSDLEPQRC